MTNDLRVGHSTSEMAARFNNWLQQDETQNSLLNGISVSWYSVRGMIPAALAMTLVGSANPSLVEVVAVSEDGMDITDDMMVLLRNCFRLFVQARS